MLQTLYKYFILHKKAIIPGIGVFRIHRKPASLDFSNKAFISPANEIAFEYNEGAVDTHFYSFLAKEHMVEEHEAINNFEAFSRKVKESLQTQSAVELPRFGLLTKDVAGKLQFKPFDPISSFYPNVPVERIATEVVKKEPVAVEVEEKGDQVAEVEMEEVQNHSTKKEYWWIFAILLAAGAIAAIIYYYNENGSLR